MFYFHIVIVLVITWTKLSTAHNFTFPSDFKFGVSTSSYQIEGAWNEDGKGENIWDRFTHDHPERIKDHSTGDISCDSYHKYKEDVQLLVALEVDFYRFSLSWARILPTGFTNRVNEKGLQYYNNLIDELLKYNIEPMVTIYHWDLPQRLQDLGGWTNPLLVTYYADYARTVFDNYGDRVKTWITFNEPKLICNYGYGDVKMAPGVNVSGIGDYLCGHTVLKAHAKAYRIYEEYFKPTQKGRVGIALHTEWFEPESEDSKDLDAAERKLTFDFGWFGNPIFHKMGDYPTIMKDRIFLHSFEEGYTFSRLPEFTEEEIISIQGSSDFLGLNMYTASMAGHMERENIHEDPSYHKDVGVKTWKDPKWPKSASTRLRVVPWSFRKLLQWIHKRYGNIHIIITESGFSDEGELEDDDRIFYYKEYLRSLLEAIKIDRINVTGFSAWSLLDNFEWFSGYKEHYGLFAVDFTNHNQLRIPKKSADYYRHVIKSRSADWDENYWNTASNHFMDIKYFTLCIVLIIFNLL